MQSGMGWVGTPYSLFTYCGLCCCCCCESKGSESRLSRRVFEVLLPCSFSPSSTQLSFPFIHTFSFFLILPLSSHGQRLVCGLVAVLLSPIVLSLSPISTNTPFPFVKASTPYLQASYPDTSSSSTAVQSALSTLFIATNTSSPNYDTHPKTRRNALLQQIPGWSRLHRSQRHPRDERSRPSICRRG